MAPFTVSGLTSVIGTLLPEPHAGLLAGLLFGTKASVSSDFYDALVTTGTLHIIALSGMNITIMEDLVGKLLVPVAGRRYAGAITIGVIVWFLWFAGASPSIVRAAIMGSLGLIAVIFGRQYWALLAWALAVSGMLVIRFSWIGDISFQLSAAATLGIILFGGQEKNGKYPIPDVATDGKSMSGGDRKTGMSAMVCWYAVRKSIQENLRLTLAAQVFTIPLTFWYFRRISLISAGANLAIGWVIVPITLLGWMTVLTGWSVLYVGQILAWFDWLLLEYLIRTIYVFSHIPFASFSW